LYGPGHLHKIEDQYVTYSFNLLLDWAKRLGFTQSPEVLGLLVRLDVAAWAHNQYCGICSEEKGQEETASTIPTWPTKDWMPYDD
jgi:hypothetical protein